MLKIQLLAATALLSIAATPYCNANNPLFVIDISNPAHVTITATAAFSEITDSGSSIGDGITLENFFIQSPDYSLNYPTLSGSLTAASVPDYVYEKIHWSGTEAFHVGLQLWNLTVFENAIDPIPPQAFVTGETAFVGTSVLDLSQYAQFLPMIGTTGNITTGYTSDVVPSVGGLVIGSYSVIPEPSTTAIGVSIVVLLFAGFGRFKRKS